MTTEIEVKRAWVAGWEAAEMGVHPAIGLLPFENAGLISQFFAGYEAYVVESLATFFAKGRHSTQRWPGGDFWSVQ